MQRSVLLRCSRGHAAKLRHRTAAVSRTHVAIIRRRSSAERLGTRWPSVTAAKRPSSSWTGATDRSVGGLSLRDHGGRPNDHPPASSLTGGASAVDDKKRIRFGDCGQRAGPPATGRVAAQRGCLLNRAPGGPTRRPLPSARYLNPAGRLQRIPSPCTCPASSTMRAQGRCGQGSCPGRSECAPIWPPVGPRDGEGPPPAGWRARPCGAWLRGQRLSF
jgi:hypothetical protein